MSGKGNIFHSPWIAFSVAAGPYSRWVSAVSSGRVAMSYDLDSENIDMDSTMTFLAMIYILLNWLVLNGVLTPGVSTFG